MTIFFRKSIYYFQISDGVCNACNGYYGPAHGQSVCPTCHAFLYANDLDLEVNVELASVERDGEDSDSGMNKKKIREISNNIRRMLPFDIFSNIKQFLSMYLGKNVLNGNDLEVKTELASVERDGERFCFRSEIIEK